MVIRAWLRITYLLLPLGWELLCTYTYNNPIFHPTNLVTLLQTFNNSYYRALPRERSGSRIQTKSQTCEKAHNTLSFLLLHCLLSDSTNHFTNSFMLLVMFIPEHSVFYICVWVCMYLCLPAYLYTYMCIYVCICMYV